MAVVSLEAMEDAGIRFAFLHGRKRLSGSAEDLSDIDLVVEQDPWSVVQRVAPAWTVRGIVPVVIWPYDIGGTATVFLATPDARDGVQLDLLHDPDAIGKYGLSSSALLATATSSTGFPAVSDIASLVYRWRKRALKRDVPGLRELEELASGVDKHDLLSTSLAITGSTDTATQMLGESHAASKQRMPRHSVRRMLRLTRRLAEPIGFWAHVSDEGVARETVRRFSRFLVSSSAGATPTRLWQAPSWAINVLPVVLRPGVFVSYGPASTWPHPDVVVESGPADAAARSITASMAARFK